MVKYDFIWYIPFEDWSFDDTVSTLVGSIVTSSFSLYIFEYYTYRQIDIWRSIGERKKEERQRERENKKRRSFYEAYHYIFWWLFFLSVFSVSSRIQIICVWMTWVLYHLSDIKMRPVAPVNITRMNGQLDVTGARRQNT